MADPVEVLDFWLDEVGPDGWYAGGAALDAVCQGNRFWLCRVASGSKIIKP